MLKAETVDFVRSNPERLRGLYDEAYLEHLRSCDPDAMRTRCEKICDRVISDYGDIPYVRGGRARDLDLTHKRSLAQAAGAILDEIRNLAIGKPAPEIDGTDLHGNRLKLSDYRGKVVVLVFWGSWCGPCMDRVPHERRLVERLNGKPFALLGVDCDEDKDEGRKATESAGITWPNWNDGAPGEGPIVERYHVRGYPSLFLIDAKGIIRQKNYFEEELDGAVDKLLLELDEAKR